MVIVIRFCARQASGTPLWLILEVMMFAGWLSVDCYDSANR